MKAAVIVDSTAYLSEALAQHPDVYQVALSVNFSDGSVMKDTSDLQLLNEFYTRLKSESQLPTTSQPQPGDYLALLDQLVAAGYDTVYAIHLDRKSTRLNPVTVRRCPCNAPCSPPQAVSMKSGAL